MPFGPGRFLALSLSIYFKTSSLVTLVWSNSSDPSARKDRSGRSMDISNAVSEHVIGFRHFPDGIRGYHPASCLDNDWSWSTNWVSLLSVTVHEGIGDWVTYIPVLPIQAFKSHEADLKNYKLAWKWWQLKLIVIQLRAGILSCFVSQ